MGPLDTGESEDPVQGAVPSLSKSDDARGWTNGRMPDARKSNEELHAIEVPVYLFGVRTQNGQIHGAMECCIIAVSCHARRVGIHPSFL